MEAEVYCDDSHIKSSYRQNEIAQSNEHKSRLRQERGKVAACKRAASKFFSWIPIPVFSLLCGVGAFCACYFILETGVFQTILISLVTIMIISIGCLYTVRLEPYCDMPAEALKADESNLYDAIVVGSGLGGLSTAACLANSGKRVLVLEQHFQIGGCSTTFTRKGFSFDVGLHVFAGFGEPSPYNLMLKLDKACGLQAQEGFELVPIPELYRVVNSNGLDLTIPSNIQEAVNYLCDAFPSDAKAVEDFFRTATKMNDDILKYNDSFETFGMRLAQMRSAFYYPRLVKGSLWDTTGSVMDSTFKDENLKLALSAMVLFMATNPYVLPFTPYCFLFPMYMLDGTYYIKGGAHNLSKTFTKIVTDNGGTILHSQKVTHVNTESSMLAYRQWWNPFNRQISVTGVDYQSTTPNKHETHTAYADVVVLNSNLKVLPKMLSNEAREVISVQPELQKFDGMKLGTSCFTVYIGFGKKLPNLPNGKPVPFSTWSLGNASSLQSFYDQSVLAPFDSRYFIFSYFSAIDCGLTPPDRPETAVGAVVLPDSFDDWSHFDHTSEAYKAKKDECCQKVFSHLEKIYPGLTDCIEYYCAGTPLTMKRYLNTPRGDMYAWEINNKHYLGERPDLRSETIDGLYFASAWSGFSHGFPGVMTSGFRCSREILKTHK